MRILVTGAAGFIGHALCRRLLDDGHEVTGLDDLNDYYDPALKRARLATLDQDEAFTFGRVDIGNSHALEAAFQSAEANVVVHLAAQAGVRYSLDNPKIYVHSNLVGFANVLECVRHHEPAHFVYASSSSIYGASGRIPFALDDPADRPVSLYAATKRSGELMAYSYSHLYDIPMTGLRFFTAYGPWGRPDMAYFKFTRRILAGEPVTVYGDGEPQRDFTYIEDIIDGVVAAIRHVPGSDGVPHRLYNLGHDQPVRVKDVLSTLEKLLGRKAKVEMRPLPPGDVPATWADIRAARDELGYDPRTGLEEGLDRFVTWYREYFHGSE